VSARPDTLVSRPGVGEPTSPALPGPGPAIPYDRDATIHDLFEAVADERGDAIAVEQGPRALSYAELDAAANRLAWGLLEGGIGPGRVVGVAVERSPDAIVAFLGVL
jgi:non-ribosomal peptide synthetase component F